MIQSRAFHQSKLALTNRHSQAVNFPAQKTKKRKKVTRVSNKQTIRMNPLPNLEELH